MLKAVFLGLIQGLTEFLPVSSTAHLVLVRWFLDWQDGLMNSLTFDVALHAGTLLSLIICFRKDIVRIPRENPRLLGLILIGTIPAGLAGILFGDFVETSLRDPLVISSTLVLFGMAMILAERFGKGRELDGLTLKDALIVGFAQAVALVPGVSRSGITISAALLMGIRRDEAARFSFLLSLPAIAGAAALEGGRLITSPESPDMSAFFVGFAASAISGAMAIKFLMSYLRRHPLNAFAYYRFALAVIIIGWLWLNG